MASFSIGIEETELFDSVERVTGKSITVGVNVAFGPQAAVVAAR
jgi:hypothetical protein